jgi:hypothetical protein
MFFRPRIFGIYRIKEGVTFMRSWIFLDSAKGQTRLLIDINKIAQIIIRLSMINLKNRV